MVSTAWDKCLHYSHLPPSEPHTDTAAKQAANKVRKTPWLRLVWDVDQSPPGALGMEPGVSLCQARPPRPCADSPALQPERGHVLQPPSPFMVAEPLFGLHRPVKPTLGGGVGVGSGVSCSHGAVLRADPNSSGRVLDGTSLFLL